MNYFWPVLMGVCVAGSDLSASEAARELGRGTDVVREWQGEQRLYVKGEVGISRERLGELERWLDANAPNWTVLVAADAVGESYTDENGRAVEGIDAVEYALGRGLRRTTGFGDLVDGRTGERNGAVLAIFLKERSFSYTGSEAQDRRMLGDAQWKGNLDRPAFRAMSNGGRVVDAVKDTVKEVEGRLSQQLALEQRARERAVVEAGERRANAANALGEARMALERLSEEAGVFAKGIPGGDGDLLRPDLAAMRADLDSGDARLADGDGEGAARVAGAVMDWVRGQRQAMAAHAVASEGFEALSARIGGIAHEESGAPWGVERLAQARVELEKARRAHARGDSEYGVFYENARQATDSGEEEIGTAKAERERRILDEREAARRAEVRAERLRNAGIAGGGLLAVFLAAGGGLLNRRRRPAKAEAEVLLASWRTGAHAKRDGLFALWDRTSVVVGSSADLSERSYAGETLRLGEQTIADVDELFIMSSALERVLREAGGLIEAKGSARWAVNLVSSENFHKAMRLLRDEPITFEPEEGIALIVRGDRTETQSLLGTLESYKPFALSFNELIREFDARAARAVESLDRIEGAWATIHAEIDAVESILDGAGSRAAEVVAEAVEDGLFAVPGLAGNWLKRARDDLGSAVAMAAGDPVRALAEPLPLARRKAEEALTLCDVLRRAREVSVPAIRRHAEALAQSGLATGWVGGALEALSDDAEKVCLAGGGEAVAARVSALEVAAVALAGRLERVDLLRVRLREKSSQALEALGEGIETARREIGKVLALPVERILREAGGDPDDRLAEGWRQHAAAKAAINRGDVGAAEGALDAVGRLVAEGNALVSDSRRSLFEHAGGAEDRRERKEALEYVVEKNGAILRELRDDYSAEALLADASDKASGTAEATIAQHVDKAEAAMARSWSLTERADAAFREGRLLEAAALLEEAGEEQAAGDRWLEAIPSQQKRIAEAEAANALKMGQVEREVAGLSDAVEDDRVMRPTMEEFGRLSRDLEGVRENLKAARRDPFGLARELARIDGALERVTRGVGEDTRWFEEARRSLREGEAAVEAARQFSQRVAGDAIPESAGMQGMQEEVERLRSRGLELQKRLEEPHGDWRAVDVEADQMTAAASKLVGEMRGELERAQESVEALASARAAVRDASGWSGEYGVRIEGAPGADLLHDAAALLQRGAYLECRRRAEDAARRARQAVSEAKAQVGRRRAEEQRQDEERRDAERRRRATSAGSVSSPSFGGSSRSGGSGMSRSGFSGGAGSGSGMGRSGW